MDYYEKLKTAITIPDIQKVYNEAFHKAMFEIEKEFALEGKGQKLVYADSIDPSLSIVDISLLIQANNRAKEITNYTGKELLITSNHNSFIEEYRNINNTP